MSTWISFVVLSLAVVSTLGFPRPDEYHIPDVGLGSRAQYYVLHSDGTYKYGYDTGDGVYEQSMAQAPGEVTGAFGYKDPAGEDIKLEYTADERGFIPHGGHLPAQPDNRFGLKITEEPSVDIQANTPAIMPLSVKGHSTTNEAVLSSANVQVEPAIIRSTAGNDGSYSFSYKTSSSSRSESADTHNSVSGQYSFDGDDGISHEISYTAGSETGYIAEGDSLPRGPAVPGAENGVPTGKIVPVLSEEEANALASSSSNVSPQTSPPPGVFESSFVSIVDAASSEETDSGEEHYAPDDLSEDNVNINPSHNSHITSLPSSVLPEVSDQIIPLAHHSDVSDTNLTETVSPSDSSYFFKYEAGDSARVESADADLNIRGSYTFVVPEGLRYTVRYMAGSDTGFVTSIKEETQSSDVNSNSEPTPCQEVPAITGDSVPPEKMDMQNVTPNPSIESNESGDAATPASPAVTNVYGKVVGSQTYVDQNGNEYRITYITAPNTGISPEEYDDPNPHKVIHSDMSPEISGKVGQLTYIDNNGTKYIISYVVPSINSLNLNEYPISIPNGVIDINAVDANAAGNVVGNQTYIDQNGNEYKITYVLATDTALTPEDDSPPSNALGSESPSGETDSLQESNENTDMTEGPAKTGVNGNVVGYGTYVDQNGTEYRITYIVPTDTDLNRNVYPIPNRKATVDTIDSQIPDDSSLTVSHKPAEITQNDPGTSLPTSHSIRKVGDVLLHQYDPTNRDKYGYVYTSIR